MISIKKIPLKFLFIFGILLSSYSLYAQIPNDILLSLNTGDAKTLSKYFNQYVQMEVLDNDNVYSKAQAQQIVSNFFSNYPPNPEKKFDAIHISNGNEGSRSVIGVFESKKGDNFRISMLLKQSEENSYIQFLKIEKTQKPQ